MVYPLLIQLKEKKQGAPGVNDEDVPESLKSTNAEVAVTDDGVDSNWFARYDYVLDEMIYAMGEVCNYHKNEPQYLSFPKGVDPIDCFGENASVRPVVDEAKKKENEEYHNRLQNGFCLFGKYFNTLWT